ncbi:MAG TPA: class I SAM-dependent methyltransferase [Candidatus Saccharimonadales bacterium]|nr:class I SAM-dependent methyltransferase [Candidatus Saccharimonadales bacterium]
MTKTQKKADQYNDSKHNYLRYWDERDYENESEQIAIKRLLKNQHYSHAVDVGGGYGRLCILLEQFSKKVTLAEPSKQQLDIAKDFLKNHPKVDRKLTQADNLDFKTDSIDLVTMIRVMHHLPNPSAEFKEINRVLTKGGTFILEIANYAHGRNRIKHWLRGKKLPIEPVDISSEANKRNDEIQFVNHNPKTVIKQLVKAGFKVEEVLSVSNLRSPTLKRIAPRNLMLAVEKFLQPALAKTYFGPSVFLLLKKL